VSFPNKGPGPTLGPYTRTLPLATCSHASGELLVHMEGCILCNVLCISVVVVVVVVFEGGVKKKQWLWKKKK